MNMLLKTILLLTGALAVWAEDSQKESFELLKESTLRVEGTSTLHDWKLEAKKMSGNGHYTVQNEGELTVSSFTLALPGEGLKSGKKGLDKNAYEALSTKKYPEIRFTLKKPIQVKENGGNHQRLSVVGDLQVAGVLKSLTTQSDCQIEKGKTRIITCSGAVPLKMTEFNITPPTAMFGAIKAGDSIMVRYNFRLDTHEKEETK